MTGRQRRRQYEYEQLLKLCRNCNDIQLTVMAQDSDGIPYAYKIDYIIKSICGINDDNTPRFANHFTMLLTLPENYPQIDASPVFRFITSQHPMPWHPNIRYYGDMAGRVCINALNTFSDLAWGVDRVAQYLRYDLYHAINEPPYPEDFKVAQWVVKYGEPNEWIFFDQPNNENEDEKENS